MNTTSRQRRERRRCLPTPVQDRNHLCLRHFGLTHHAARVQKKRGPEDYDDLQQEACIGALAACERFEASRGLKPSSYILGRAHGQMLHYRRDRSRLLSIPWRQRDLVIKGQRLQEARRSSAQQPLSEQALADQLGVSVDRWRRCQQAVEITRWVSLDQTFPHRDDAVGSSLLDQIPAPGPVSDPQLRWLQQQMTRLSSQQRQWLEAHYIDGLSIHAVAERFGINASLMRRELRHSMNLLRQWATRDQIQQPQPSPEQLPAESGSR